MNGYRSILLTGGAGFLGRGIIRRLQSQHSSAQITVYSRDEIKHYALRARFPHVRTVLGDINDADRLEAVMPGHDLVLHLAALKHIPEAERDAGEAVRVNVDGSRAVLHAALRTDGVKAVVGISTDKVASPRNTYGATKMLMERLFQEAQRHAGGSKRFATVRYGNVVSSTGSVIPLFRDQLKRDGMVSITSPEMTRFWISIDDAVTLVERAATGHERGMTYVARCAGMRIVDVAQAVWEMERPAGALAPSIVPNRVIGTRPGEKLHECLIDSYEAPYAETDGQYVLIPPATSLAGEGTHQTMPYESSHPDSWLTVKEMRELIVDSATV